MKLARVTLLLCLFIIVCLVSWSCLGPERSNPLEGTEDHLFIPQISKPTGGEQWFVGSSEIIRWNIPEAIADTVVTIQLIHQGQSIPIGENITNIGEFSWTVPDLISPNCRIRITGSIGFSDSPEFRISPKPVLQKIETGMAGWHPAALRDFIIFTSERDTNHDLWFLNRITGSLIQLTSDNGFDGEAAWFKPNGTVFAFTSDRSGRKEIWMMAVQGPTAFMPTQVSTLGGDKPVWQPSFFTSPSVAYRRKVSSRSSLYHIFATTLAFPTSAIIPLPVPVPVLPEIRLTDAGSEDGSLTDIQFLAWGSPGSSNMLVYETGEQFPLLWQLNIPLDADFAITDNNKSFSFFVPNISSPIHPAFSPVNSARIAFSASGDLWTISNDGRELLRLTDDDWENDYPDWATPTEIIFQRRPSPDAPWEIWSLQVPSF